MKKETILGEGVCPPFSNFSQGLMVDGVKRVLFIAGQFPVDENGELVGKGDIEAQSRKVYANIEALCKAAGGSLENVAHLNMYVTDIRFRAVVTGIRNEIFAPPYPTATMVQIGSLSGEDWLVEIDAIAVFD